MGSKPRPPSSGGGRQGSNQYQKKGGAGQHSDLARQWRPGEREVRMRRNHGGCAHGVAQMVEDPGTSWETDVPYAVFPDAPVTAEVDPALEPAY